MTEEINLPTPVETPNISVVLDSELTKKEERKKEYARMYYQKNKEKMSAQMKARYNRLKELKKTNHNEDPVSEMRTSN